MATSGKYRESVVTFLDILGFGEIVDTKSDVEIFEIMESFRQEAHPDELNYEDDGEFSWEDDVTFISFSDCVVRTRRLDGKLNSRYRVGHLFHEIWALAMLQIDMLSRNVLLRGGVTLGHVSHQGDIIFGPALVRAYQLESKVAQHPRIILDDGSPICAKGKTVSKGGQQMDLQNSIGTRTELVGDANTPEQERDFFDALTSQDPDDGVIFIDYLRFAQSECDEIWETFDIWTSHQQLVRERLSQYKSDTSGILEKYEWLARYHDRTMDFFRRGCLEVHNYDLNDLKV